MSRFSRLRIPAWLWGGALVLLLMTAYSLRQTRRMQSQLRDVSARIHRAQQERGILDSERANYQRALDILSDTNTRPFPLAPLRPALPTLRAYFSPSHGLLIVGGHVPAPATGKAFRGWIVTTNRNTAVALTFLPDAQGQVLSSYGPGTWQRGQILEISEEPLEAAPAPPSKALWRGTLP